MDARAKCPQFTSDVLVDEIVSRQNRDRHRQLQRRGAETPEAFQAIREWQMEIE